MRSLYHVTHEIANSRRVSGAPLKSKYGRTLTTEDEQNVHWVEHFKEVLNQPIPPILNDELEAGTPLAVMMADITPGKVHVVVKCLQNNKVPGLDEISGELLKVAGNTLIVHLTDMLNKIWQSKEVPIDWTKGVIIALLKKGNLSDCDSWWGITLLSIPCKVLCKVLLNWLKMQLTANSGKNKQGSGRVTHVVNRSLPSRTSLT